MAANPVFSIGIGLVLVLIGVLAFFGGISMDTTKTTTTCYEVDGAYGSNGCVETTYQDPSGQILATTVGIFAIVGGGYLTMRGTRSVNTVRSQVSRTDSSQKEHTPLRAQIEERKNNDE